MPEHEKTIVIETQHSEQIATVQRDLSQLGTRFDRHLEIYAQNGKELQGLKVNVGNMTSELKSFGQKFDDMDKKFVSQDQFSPVRILAYGLVGTTLIGVLTALLSYVVFPRASSQEQINQAASAAASNALQDVLSNYQTKVK